MKKVLILGATGAIGRPLTETLLKETDYEVTAFARHARDRWQESERLAVVNGDATSEKDLAAAITGQDVVYCAFLIDRLPEVAKKLVNIMKKAGNIRLIFMSSVGIYNEIPKEMDDMDNLANNPAQVHNRRGADIIEASDLNYTIVRSGYWQPGDKDDFVLTRKNEPAKGYITTIPSLVRLLENVITDDKTYVRDNITITKKMD